VSSRTVFRPKGVKLPQVDGYSPEQDIWWTVAEKYDLENKLKAYPNIVLFGEVYGAVQDLKYGVPASEEVRFAAFDAMYADTRTYMDAGDFLEFCRKIDVPAVPTLHWGPWSKDLAKMSEGKSVLPKADHVREGIVIKPTTEKRDNRIGRKFLKMAGEGYLTRKSDQ
jgi:RNA ligase (TIGR02306 family)